MATKQRSRSRRPRNDSAKGPRYVAPVLDPTWQSPYAPSIAEREANAHAVRRFALRFKLPQTIGVSVVILALLVAGAFVPVLFAVAVLVAGLYAWDLRRSLANFDKRGNGLGAAMLAQFTPGGTPTDRQRLVTVLGRLTATFGVDNVSAFIVADGGYNAALAPNGGSFSLFVTTAMMSDFELIELEGVIAHLLARHRLGLLGRESTSAMLNVSLERRRSLAGVGQTYRADEVAAAAIRYPLGLAGALRRCARQVMPKDSFFLTSTYDQWRFIFFNVFSDRPQTDMSDLDDVELRASALEEW